MVVESPFCAGTFFDGWLCKEGDVLPIGTAIARILPEEAKGESRVHRLWQDPTAVDGYALKSRPSWRGTAIGDPAHPRPAAPPTSTLTAQAPSAGIQQRDGPERAKERARRGGFQRDSASCGTA